MSLSATAAPSSFIADNYIVVFHDSVDLDSKQTALTQRFPGMGVNFQYRHALKGMAIRLPAPLVAILERDPDVAYIEQDQILHINAQTLSTGIDRTDYELNPIAAIDEVDTRVDVDIAILDSGVDLDHPDLNVFKYTLCAQQGIRYRCTEGDAGADDVNGHGTHVAGIAAALDNTVGVVGMAPGARIWNVKVMEDNGDGIVSKVIAGVDYVTANAASIEVANMSLTGIGSSSSLDTAISNAATAGVVFTLAAGNDSVDVSTAFPAGHPQAITVSAFTDYDGLPGGLSGNTKDDTFATYSNYGTGVDIMAPGTSIRSTRVGGGYTSKSGTSMAAPHVAGAAALYLVQHPGASVASVKSALVSAGDPAPCASVDGICNQYQDPDGVQEPLLCNDQDGDSICDYLDSCPTVDNTSTLDSDGDLLNDFDECLLGTDPYTSNTGDLAPAGAPDGLINVADILVLSRIVEGDLTATGSDLVFGDLNQDGQLDNADTLLLQQAIEGLRSL